MRAFCRPFWEGVYTDTRRHYHLWSGGYTSASGNHWVNKSRGIIIYPVDPDRDCSFWSPTDQKNSHKTWYQNRGCYQIRKMNQPIVDGILYHLVIRAPYRKRPYSSYMSGRLYQYCDQRPFFVWTTYSPPGPTESVRVYQMSIYPIASSRVFDDYGKTRLSDTRV